MSDNIVGKDHLDYVKSQIKVRQEILGKPFRDSKDVTWMNGKNSWVKLMSSVNIKDENVLKYDEINNKDVPASNNGVEFRNQYLGTENYKGNELAKENILHAGTKNKTELRFGVADSLDLTSNTLDNYGFANDNGQRGLQPMPGITSFSTKTYNKGSLRNATLQITAHSSQQFKYIDSLYLRLGYTMLVEWGNTMYPILNEDGSTRYSTHADIAGLSLQSTFMKEWNKGTSYFYTLIEERRKQSQGNYDGFLGKVTNFSWEFTKDGSYLITLDLISIGSVVESLKINNNFSSIKYFPKEQSQNSLNNDPDVQRINALEVIIDILANSELTQEGNTSVRTYVGSGGNSVTTINTNYILSPSKTELTDLESSSLGLPKNFDSGSSLMVNCIYGENNNNSGSKFYLRLGTLLKVINDTLLIYTKKDDQNKPLPLIRIDTNPDNFCYSNKFSFSGDPSKMINRLELKLGNNEINAFPQADIFHDTYNGQDVGRIMNLYFERDYLKSIIQSNTDENGDLFLYNFLKDLTITANRLLGGVNKLNLRITQKETDTDTIEEVIEFYDEVPFIKTETESNFNVFGFHPNSLKEIQTKDEDDNGITQQISYNGGSFITDFNLKTEISKNLSTQISIGAQAQGRAVGEDATIFSKWNVGLVDRVIPAKLDIDKLKKQNASQRTDFRELQNIYRTFLLFLTDSKFQTISDWEYNWSSTVKEKFSAYVFPNLFLASTDNKKPTFTKFEDIQKQYFTQALAWDAERKNIATPFIGFIPIKFNMTMDGLSGIRIFDKLTIDSRFLPQNYTDTLDFIITELDHKFEGNKWFTSVGTLSMPKLHPDKRVEVADTGVTSGSFVVSPSDDENRIYPNSEIEPSYFYIKPDVVNAYTFKGGEKGYRTQDIEKVLQYINKSPLVQTKFRNFFTRLLSTYEFGYEFSINSILRKLTTTEGVGLNSEHIWAMSIDMSVKEARPGTENPSTNILYGLDQTPEGAAKWRELGIPDIAIEEELRWGGNWTTGSWVYDTVHFGAIQEWGLYNTAATNKLFSQIPTLKAQLQNKNGRTRYTKPSNPDGFDYVSNWNTLNSVNLQNYLLVEKDSQGNLQILGNPNNIEMLRGQKSWIGLKEEFEANSFQLNVLS